MSLRSRRFLATSWCAASLALPACSKPEPPTVRPLSITTTAVSPERLNAAVELDVHNPNGFVLSVQSVNGVLSLADGAPLGTAHAEPRTPLPAKASTRVSLNLDMPWQNLTALAPFALSGADVKYRFLGVASLGGERLNTDVSFVLEGKLSRDELLQLGLRGFGGG